MQQSAGCTRKLVATMMLFAASITPSSFAQNQTTFQYGDGYAKYTVLHKKVSLNNGVLVSGQLPTWSRTFTYQGVNYSYTMIGTDPAVTNFATTIPVYIIPLNFTFFNWSAGLSSNQNMCNDSASAITRVLNSPLFTNSVSYSPGGTNVGTTQYIDAFQRANYWSNVGTTSPNYHIYLSVAAVKPLQTINVPRTAGYAMPGPCTKTGEVDVNWFDAIANNLITTLQIPTNALPVFVSYDTFWTESQSCCLLGYHSATTHNQGYVVAAYSDPGIFLTWSIANIQALSHELGEWLDDPLTTNYVPNWGNVGQVVGCTNYLEVGDPVAGISFPVTTGGITYDPEDLVFHDWFTRASPSTAVNHWYTFMNTFHAPAAHCP